MSSVVVTKMENQYDAYFASLVQDYKLYDKYMQCKACQLLKGNVADILSKNIEDAATVEKITQKIVSANIPPSVKSCVRGKFINDHVRKCLMKEADALGCAVTFEKKHPCVSEIPDWTLTWGEQTYIGFNQYDLWGGGAQLNRCSKYVMDDALHSRLAKKNIYIICIVVRRYRDAKPRSTSKAHTMILKGVKTKRLFWLKGFKTFLRETICGESGK